MNQADGSFDLLEGKDIPVICKVVYAKMIRLREPKDFFGSLFWGISGKK